MAQSIAGYEASAEVTTFSSKFDALQAGKAQFAPQEQTGYDIFRSEAQCNACHRDGVPAEDPLFTDFSVIFFYSGWSYWVFRGKMRADVGYH
jgi:cytochrome c peroxidase